MASEITSRPKSQARPLPRVLRSFVPIVTLTLCWSCGGGATDVPEDAAEREVFIETYVDLRATALTAGTTEIEAGVRDSILAVYGVTGEELVEFIDIHGEDVQFMGDLWGEIEGLLTERLEQYRTERRNELEEN